MNLQGYLKRTLVGVQLVNGESYHTDEGTLKFSDLCGIVSFQHKTHGTAEIVIPFNQITKFYFRNKQLEQGESNGK